MSVTGQRVMHDLRDGALPPSPRHGRALLRPPRRGPTDDPRPERRGRGERGLHQRPLRRGGRCRHPARRGGHPALDGLAPGPGDLRHRARWWRWWPPTSGCAPATPTARYGGGWPRLNAFLQESLAGMAVIQLFAREGGERRQFQDLNRDYRRALFGSTVFESSLYASVEALGFVALAVLLWYGGGQIVARRADLGGPGRLHAVHESLLPAHSRPGREVHRDAGGHDLGRTHLRRPRPDPRHPVAPTSRSGRPGSARGGRGRLPRRLVRLPRGPVGPARIVRSRCGAGERVALVGATGEGKTTCGRLLTRSYDVPAGPRARRRGRRAGVGICARLRRHVGVVFQESVLFTGTVEANLRSLRRPCAARTRSCGRPRRPARAPSSKPCPRGWHTELSERGANISHGERQLAGHGPSARVQSRHPRAGRGHLEHRPRVGGAHSGRDVPPARRPHQHHHRASPLDHPERRSHPRASSRARSTRRARTTALLRRGGLYARFCELQFGAGVGACVRAATAFHGRGLPARPPHSPGARAHLRGDRRAGWAAGRGARRRPRDARLPARHPVASRGERPRAASACAPARAGW